MPPEGTNDFRSRLVDARAILLVGLGGLLALMTASGVYTIRSLSGIRARHESIRALFLQRNETLNQIRSDLYVTTTYIRDYLLDPEPQSADENRRRFEIVRGDLTSRTEQYARLAAPEQAQRWRELRDTLNGYWALLAPVWTWDQQTRRERGYDFYRSEVVARRSHLLGIADEIAAINNQQLTRGDRELDDVFGAVQSRLLWSLVASMFCGGALALVSMVKLLAMERRAAEQFHQTAEARAALQELSARLVSAQEEERKSISRELHDEVGQSLSGLLVAISNLRAQLSPAERPELRDQLQTIRRLAEESVRVVRNMALLLRPSMLDDLGLVEALQWQARETSRNHGLDVRVEAEDVPDPLPERYATCVYRVVQEALHNAVRHSGASHVDIRLRGGSSGLALAISDDGKGLQPGAARGLGILGMQERVTHLGGTFETQSEPGHGTRIVVALPVESTETVPS